MESMFEVPFKDSVASADRMKVIAVSVQIEAVVSISIARLLGFTSPKETRSFGNTSAALSFNAKLNLFLDIKGITKEQANVLIKFSEIRNKFAHVADINTIFDCLEASDKSLKLFLEKRYCPKINNYNYDVEGTHSLFLTLLDDVEATCFCIATAMFNKIQDDTKQLVKTKRSEILRKSLLGFQPETSEEKQVIKKILLNYKKESAAYDFEKEVLALI